LVISILLGAIEMRPPKGGLPVRTEHGTNLQKKKKGELIPEDTLKKRGGLGRNPFETAQLNRLCPNEETSSKGREKKKKHPERNKRKSFRELPTTGVVEKGGKKEETALWVEILANVKKGKGRGEREEERGSFLPFVLLFRGGKYYDVIREGGQWFSGKKKHAFERETEGLPIRHLMGRKGQEASVKIAEKDGGEQEPLIHSNKGVREQPKKRNCKVGAKTGGGCQGGKG